MRRSPYGALHFTDGEFPVGRRPNPQERTNRTDKLHRLSGLSRDVGTAGEEDYARTDSCRPEAERASLRELLEAGAQRTTTEVVSVSSVGEPQ
jgi:hypothetical protein